MQDDQKKAWEQQARDHEAEQVARETKELKAIVVAKKKDQEAQVKIQTDEAFDDIARRANRIYDAETYTLEAQAEDTKDTAAQTIRYELKQQSWFPSWGIPAFPWYRNTPDPLIPSPLPGEDDDANPCALEPRGPKEEKEFLP